MSFFLQLNTEEDIQKNVGNQMEAIDFHCNFISLLWKQIIIIIPYIYIVIFWALKALYIQGGGDLINHHQPNGYCQLFGYQYSSKYNIFMNS